MSGRGNFPLYPSWVLVAGLIIKLTRDRWTGEKETYLNCVHGGSKEMTLRSGQSRQLLYLLDKETVHWWGTDRTKKPRFGCSISKESKQTLGLGSQLRESQDLFIQPSWPNSLSLAIRTSFYLWMQGEAPFTTEIYFLLQGDREEGQSVPLALGVS